MKNNLFQIIVQKLNSNLEIKKIVANTGWLAVEKIAKIFVSLFVGVWVTRYLGAEQYGIYSYALSFAVLFKAFASFGIDSIVIRDLVKYKEKHALIMGTGFFLKVFGGLLSFALITVVLLLSSLDLSTKIYIWIITSSTTIYSIGIIDLYFQSEVKSRYIVKANTITVVLSSLLKIFFILIEAPLLAFVCISLFEGLVMGIGYLYSYKKNALSVWDWRFDFKLAKSMLKESWPLILSMLAISVAMRIDQIMLKSYVSLEELGYYAVGVRLAEAATFLPMVIGQSIYPKIIKTDFVNNKSSLKQMISNVFYPLSGISLIISLLGTFIIRVLYGETFLESGQILSILIWTIPFIYFGIFSNNVLTVEGKQKIIFVKQFSLTILNICLNLYLIPIYGIVGAAWSTLIAELVVNTFMDGIFKKSRWLFILKLKSILFIRNPQ
ncbi:flippase [Flagellimonas sp. GZD32]|uniref:flippase n=1 Tax=Flagellimonas cixiensis TaxID=3228750 RepID=UPI0035C8BA97